MSNSVKRQIEVKLMDAYLAIPRMLPPSEWVSSKQFDNFIQVWWELREVYILDNTLIDFHVDVMDMYRAITEYLYSILLESDKHSSVYEMTLEAIKEVDGVMDELTREAQRNFQSHEDYDDTL